MKLNFLHNEFKLNKYKNILKSSHFRSAFSLLFLLVILFFAIGGFRVAFQNLYELRSALEEKADYAASDVQNSLSTIKNCSVFIGNLTSINHLLYSDNPTIDQLVLMSKDVTPYASFYDYESICIFLNQSQRIYDTSGGMYYYDDFYNPDFLEFLKTQTCEEFWLIDVPYARYYAPDPAVSVILYGRRLPLYSTGKQGYVTIAYPFYQLKNIAANSVSQTKYTACITFQNQLLWSNSASVNENWDASVSVSENETALFPHSIVYSSFVSDGAVCSFYVSNQQLAMAVFPPLLRWFLLCIIAVIAVFIASSIYSALMLRHMDAMMRKIGLIPYTEGVFNGTDEFLRMNSALDNLNSKMSNADTVMRENRQLVQERLLSGILYNYVDFKNLPPEYEQHGLIFPYPYYAVLLIRLSFLEQTEDYTKYEQIRLIARSNTTSALSVLGSAYSLYTDNNSICILLNTGLHDTLQEVLSKICLLLKQRMKKKLAVYPLFSIGICSESDPRPWQAYQLARRNYIFTATDSDDFVLFGFQNEFTPIADPDLLSLLSQAIIDKDQERLKELTNLFHERYLDMHAVSEYRRLSTIALCTVYSTLLDMSGDMQNIQFNTWIRKLENATTAEECEKNFYACLFSMLNAENKISQESHGYIQKAILYLEQHYHESISIPQIADHVGISPIYLTKLFKLSTGKTLSEYLNFYRNQRSLELLVHTNNTINEISAKVGYSDVRSYIRFFKKFYQMTPGKYRQEHANDGIY